MATTEHRKTPNLDCSSLFDNARFSDLIIRFADREIKAHRFVLCEQSEYFNKLCGPDSPFFKAKERVVTLHDDDPDAAEAMIRHLYNFTPKVPPFDRDGKVRFYCKVVVAADKYGIPGLAEEAENHLKDHLVNSGDPRDVVASLKIVSEEYGDYDMLESCVSWQLRGRMNELASTPGFLVLLASQPKLLGDVVADALRYQELKRMRKCRCAFCHKIHLQTEIDYQISGNPFCCKNRCGFMGNCS